jgi:signal transduction histidine kinase
MNTSNLFVPFFTTKPGGSGIGLALGRQIAEAHGGTLNLENRRDRLGCVATLSLHLSPEDENAAAGLLA